MNPAEEGKLCLSCALCCNGVIFADVRLQPGDDPEGMREAGLPLRPWRGGHRLRQPCGALDGCKCQAYDARPTYCRTFDCALLKSVRAGLTSAPAAGKVVRTARQRADKVLRLVRELGNVNESAPLSARFRAVARRFEDGVSDTGEVELFGELTMAMHDLNVLLSRAFYPGEGE